MNLFNRAISLTLPAVPRPIIRYFSRPYIAGTTIDEAFGIVRRLNAEGAVCTLDILGEFTRSREQARAGAESYLELLRRIHEESDLDTNVSVKLSALGLLIDRELCLEGMTRLLQAAESYDRFVRIDMEDSECTTPTLELFLELHERFPKRVGVVLQSRLRRTLDDVDRMNHAPANYRLCKGIYLEPREIAYTDRELIRRNFVAVLDLMLEKGAYVGIATQDELLVLEALRLIRHHGIARDGYEFQMLLGVDRQLRRLLIAAGHRLRVYVPFGKHWYEYSVRRLRENPQIVSYALQAILARRDPRLTTGKKHRSLAGTPVARQGTRPIR